MNDCIFCKIVNKEIKSAKIWEDKDFLAILDAYPNTKGMTVVLTKEHHPSYVFDMKDDFFRNFMLASKRVARLLDEKLGVKRTAMVMEGMGVNHAHVKLYPLHGLDEKFKETWSNREVFFERYEGFVSTQLGPKADSLELEKLAKRIRGEP